MSVYTIKQGNHYDTRLISTFPLLTKAPNFKRLVRFDASCAYELPAYNSQDVNKLFGFSLGFLAVHKNSARFGWRYSSSKQAIELLAYCYTQGKRNQDAQLEFPLVATVPLGQEILLELDYDRTEGTYTFSTYTPTGGFISCLGVETLSNLPWFGLTHSLYFGGDCLCPHNMTITMKKFV